MSSRRKPLAALTAVTAALAIAVPAASASAATPHPVRTHDGLVCPLSGDLGISLLGILNLGGSLCSPNPDATPPTPQPYLPLPLLSWL